VENTINMKIENFKKPKEKSKFPSEFRLDLVSKDWVIVATGRARRPETFKRVKRKKDEISRKKCPFCQKDLVDTASLVFSNNKKIPLKTLSIFKKKLNNWTTIAIPNKFPAFLPASRLETKIEGGLYQKINAIGFHEIIVTRDHEKSIALLSISKIKELIDVYQERFLYLMKQKFVSYIAIFHNHGFEAGASISHPHSQIAAIPLIDTDLRAGLSNSKNFFKKERECMYCLMCEWERRVKTRIIFENEDFSILCPFASKAAFEVIISPKKHSAYFEKIQEKEKWNLAEALKIALSKIYKGLNDPPYNFYLHTAPCDGADYDFYHWHFTILPKTSTWAGFELGAGMEISTIEPEKAAEYLRKQ